MRTMTSYAQWFVSAVSRLAQDLDASLRRTCCAPHYVWFKPRGLAFAITQDGEPKPEGFELARPEPFRGDLSVEQMGRQLHDVLSRVPVLPGDR